MRVKSRFTRLGALIPPVAGFLHDNAHVAEPLYGLLKKGRKFEWRDEHTKSVWKMKEALAAAPALRKAV